MFRSPIYFSFCVCLFVKLLYWNKSNKNVCHTYTMTSQHALSEMHKTYFITICKLTGYLRVHVWVNSMSVHYSPTNHYTLYRFPLIFFNSKIRKAPHRSWIWIWMCSSKVLSAIALRSDQRERRGKSSAESVSPVATRAETGLVAV